MSKVINVVNEPSRADQLFAQHRLEIYRQTDRLFAGLMIFQWLAGILIAIWISPLTWAGLSSETHPHVWAALLLGGAIASLPVLLALFYPGRAFTRHTVAVGQMLASALLIHLTGGRIETHFHVFGTLTFLAFYRNWRVLITASAVIAVDHFLRGIYWPQSAYGVSGGVEWRWLEHAGWVVFLDVFLIYACVQSVREMRAIADRQARLEAINLAIEDKVRERTVELEIAILTLQAEVAERKRAEEALRASEQRARLILDTAYDAYVSMDASGRINGWNRQAEATFGWSGAEALGRLVSETIIPPRHRAQHDHGLKRFRETGEGDVLNQRIEVIALHRDGHEFPAEMTVTPLQLGDTFQFNAFVHDITKRQRVAAELLEAKEAAESANHAKSEFLANMSHEIRTPMNGILGMTELALDTALTAEQHEYLDTIKSSGDALLNILNDILDFSKIEARKLDLNPVPFDLHDCLGDTLKLLAPRAHTKGLELACQVPAAVPPKIVGDSGRLRQVLVNLLGNAVKFTSTGEIVVRVQVADGDMHNADGASNLQSDVCNLQFSVRDTGLGIAASKLAKIFDPFEQADGSTTRRYGGTGLGLTISSRLVGMMGGRIWVESDLGRGSTFHFTARFGVATDLKVAPASPQPLRLRGVPVLVVDDNATNRQILIETLTTWGMQPIPADGGANALAVLRRAANAGSRFELVLLDSQMPDLDGFEVASRIQRDTDLGVPSIMMLTSSDRQGDAARCRDLGLASYLIKPVRQAELLDAILTVLGTAKSVVTQPEGGDARAEAWTPSFGRLRVLLAEDNVVNQRLAVRLLEKRGLEVFVAENGRDAVAAYKHQPFDVVLMDVQMPDMGGIEATAAIRALEHGTSRHTPIIAMTAHALAGDRERFLAAGMDGYVAKPIRAVELLSEIEYTLASHNGSSPDAPPHCPEESSGIPSGADDVRETDRVR